MKKGKGLYLLLLLLAIPMLLAAKPTEVKAADHGALHQEVINGKKYFIYEDGTHLTGWYKLATFKLYLDPEDDGAAVVGYQKLDDGEYVFNKDGVVNCIYGTPIIDGKKYWVTGDGTIRTGWQRLGSMKLYFDPEKKYALTGKHEVDGVTYFFDKNGVATEQAGTPIFDGNKYWIKKDGSMGTGWMKLTTWIMYFDPETGIAATGRKVIDGKNYLFNSDGVCYITPRTDLIEGHKYWYNSDGSLRTGWTKLTTWTMYFYPDKWYAATGDVTIDGVKYTFNSDGVLTSGNSPLENKPTATPTPTPTPTPIVTPIPTPTVTPTPKPTPTPTLTPSKPVHTHSWRETFTPVFHAAVTHTVHHDATGHYETKVIADAWDEPVYANRTICNGCGADITGNTKHIYWCPPGSYRVLPVQVDTTHHPAVTEQVWVQDSAAWDETIVDKEAWTESVSTGFVCDSCGATK